MTQGWIGLDLDGTLAYYDEWRGIEHIGEPIPAMLERVKRWIKEGKEVRIFTARVSRNYPEVGTVRYHIVNWCLEHIGVSLVITNQKDFNMIELWDDRVVQVQKNTGKILGYSTRGLE